ncbi:hypothetical protein MTR_4g036305 [Medicago truncatula]|uniref:Uncharacterized protein n=1 Tax=Medicago truncatula TaxID=3880 RepID=A0A072UJ19_MEDTR|nr:hypothetical protein MTR_4g036305 [Medicago truncatula]
MSSFQGRTWRIPSSIPMGNNVWPVRIPLRMNQISRLPLVGRKPVSKILCKSTKNKNLCMNTRNK